jgi:subtilisin family serine protease
MNKLAPILAALALLSAANVSAETFVVLANGQKFDDSLVSSLELAGGDVRYLMKSVGIAVVDSDAEGFLNTAESIDGIRSVSHDLPLQWQQDHFGELISSATVEPPFTGDDDFFFDLQWGHAAIDTQDAWARGHRGAGVRVAVLDTGIDVDHFDLAANINVALSTSFVPGEPVDTSVLQPNGSFNHGSHVAGVIAAADNGFGTIGVAPEAELVAIKVLSQIDESGSSSGILAGMFYAGLIEADVINMSLGFEVPRNCTFGSVHFPARDCAELMVAGSRIANFIRQQGGLLIVAAGNSARDLDHDAALKEFPVDLPGVVRISATGPDGWAYDPLTDLDLLASYSNFGSSVIDFAAPGGDFRLFLRGDFTICNGPVIIDACGNMDQIYSTVNGGGPGQAVAYYTYTSGTSMAAPHAAGVAALIIGASGGDMHPAAVVAAMRAGADDLGKPGKDPAYGHGRINAANSVP